MADLEHLESLPPDERAHLTMQWRERLAQELHVTEAAVLVAAMGGQHDEVLAHLEPDHFWTNSHRAVYESIVAVADREVPHFDAVVSDLVASGRLDEAGGGQGVLALGQVASATRDPVADLLRLVKRRDMLRGLDAMHHDLLNPTTEPDDAAADLIARLSGRTSLADDNVLTFSQLLDAPVEPFLVDAMVSGGVSMLFGAYKSAKSYVALGLAWAVATGESWMGQDVTDPGPVIYLAGEGRGDLTLRSQAMLDAGSQRPADDQLLLVDERFSLSEPRGAARLRLLTQKHQARLVVVDTWATYSGLSDENDAAETQRAVNAVADVARDGTSVLIVHHTNADGKNPRGSTALRGAIEYGVRTDLDPDTSLVQVTPVITRRYTGWRGVTLGFRRHGPDSILVRAGSSVLDDTVDRIVHRMARDREVVWSTEATRLACPEGQEQAVIIKLGNHQHVAADYDDNGRVVGFRYVGPQLVAESPI